MKPVYTLYERDMRIQKCKAELSNINKEIGQCAYACKNAPYTQDTLYNNTYVKPIRQEYDNYIQSSRNKIFNKRKAIDIVAHYLETQDSKNNEAIQEPSSYRHSKRNIHRDKYNIKEVLKNIEDILEEVDILGENLKEDEMVQTNIIDKLNNVIDEN
jgi:hypothetical protein|uniref:Uncharacterized protein n=1 Tax=viral metagenome TaxID=1070528 RepID=A0A6C0JD81_9ZZZZ